MSSIQFLFIALLSSLVLTGCFDMSQTYDFKSKEEVKFIQTFAINKNALKNYKKQQKLSTHPVCQYKSLGEMKFSLNEKGKDSICTIKGTMPMDQLVKSSLTPLKGQAGHEVKFEKIKDKTYRYLFAFNLKDIKNMKKQNKDDPKKMMEILESVFKSRKIQFKIVADKIIKSTGKISDDKKTAIMTINIIDMFKSDKKIIKAETVFKIP